MTARSSLRVERWPLSRAVGIQPELVDEEVRSSHSFLVILLRSPNGALVRVPAGAETMLWTNHFVEKIELCVARRAALAASSRLGSSAPSATRTSSGSHISLWW